MASILRTLFSTTATATASGGGSAGPTKFRVLILVLLNLVMFLHSSSAAVLSSRQLNVVDFDISTLLDGASEQFMESPCGQAMTRLVSFIMTDDSCPSLFLSLTDYISNVELPSVSVDRGGPQVTFNPPTVPELLSSFEGVCATGACIPNLALIFEEIDEECFDITLPFISAYGQKQLRLIRAFANVLCTRDNANELCVPKVIASFEDVVSDALGLGTSSTSGTFENVGISARDTFCSSCSINFQRSIYSALEVDPNMAIMSQLACLMDSVTGSECSTDEMLMGFSYVASPSELLWNLAFDEDDDLCPSPCAMNAVGITAPFFDNKYPSSCYKTVSDPNDYVTVKFAIDEPKSVLFIDDAAFKKAIEDDLAIALRLPKEYFAVTFEKVNSSIHRGASSLMVTVEIVGALSAAPLDEKDAMTMIEGSPFTNLNSNYAPKLESFSINMNPSPLSSPGTSKSTIDDVGYVWIVLVALLFGLIIMYQVNKRRTKKREANNAPPAGGDLGV